MTPADMISQLGTTAPGIEQLNVPAYQWQVLHNSTHTHTHAHVCTRTRAHTCVQVHVHAHALILTNYTVDIAPTTADINVLCTSIFPQYARWSEALHGVAGYPGVHFGGKVTTLFKKKSLFLFRFHMPPHFPRSLV